MAVFLSPLGGSIVQILSRVSLAQKNKGLDSSAAIADNRAAGRAKCAMVGLLLGILAGHGVLARQ